MLSVVGVKLGGGKKQLDGLGMVLVGVPKTADQIWRRLANLIPMFPLSNPGVDW